MDLTQAESILSRSPRSITTCGSKRYPLYCLLSQNEVMKSHTKRVMGLAADKKLGYVYSIGEDCKFKLTEINAHSVVCDLQPGKAPLKHMIYNPSRAIFIMGDSEGNVFVYSQNHVLHLSS